MTEMRNLTGGYQVAFVFFASAVTLASLLVLAAAPPRTLPPQ